METVDLSKDNIYVFISIDLGGIFYNIFSIITSQMFPKMKKEFVKTAILAL